MQELVLREHSRRTQSDLLRAHRFEQVRAPVGKQNPKRHGIRIPLHCPRGPITVQMVARDHRGEGTIKRCLTLKLLLREASCGSHA